MISVKLRKMAFSQSPIPWMLSACLLAPLAIVPGAMAQTTGILPEDLDRIAKEQEKVKKVPASFINTWLLSGLFDNDAANSGYERDWVGETQAQPTVGSTAGNGTWKYFDDRLFSRNYDDYQDLFSYFRVKQGQSVAAKVVYAHVYVYSPVAQGAQLRIGADNSFKAWLNGAPIVASTNSSPIVGSPSTVGLEAPATAKNSGKDYVTTDVQLVAGWNRLLLKIANQQDGRFGFYARLTDVGGMEVPGLFYSISGGSGQLKIATSAMPEAKTGEMPVAYREWPYVSAQVDVKAIQETADRDEGPLDILVANQGVANSGLLMNASDFALTAEGGAAPYSWTFAGGELPPGLKLEGGGFIRGTVLASAPLRDYKFTARVRDSKGMTAQKTLTIALRERPNKWYEEDRLAALIHGPENISPTQFDDFVTLMKRQGYRTGMPISYNNGDFLFRWPAPLAKKKTDIDWVQRYKTALEKQGLKFGMYMGNMNNIDTPDFDVNQQVLVIADAMEKYKPKALWFDWSNIDATSVDSLYSVIKSYDPEAVVILNGSVRGSSGDWDIIDFEAWGSWGERSWAIWPVKVPWPKKHAEESWRLLVTPDFSMSKDVTTDWQEMLRMQLALIGEGFIANIDHSPTITAKAPLAKLSDSQLMQMHMKMADWASPKGLPPLYTSYTGVNPGPLQDAFWGYDTTNVKRDTIYLHLMETPYGKHGKPNESTLTFGPVEGKVKSVTWMNKNKNVKFSQRNTSTDRTVTVELGGIAQDPIDTILKVELEKPLAEAPVKVVEGALPGNLAANKPSQLLSTDGLRTLMPSARQIAKNGVDGKLSTTAAGAWEYAWMYHVDLEQAFSLTRIVVNFSKGGYATEYKVLVSDNGTDWKIVADVKGNQEGGPHTHTFAPVDARYVRVQAGKPDGPDQPGGQMSIAELEVYEQQVP
jgi:hypothetical protein